jgi:hypothetical protein
VRLAQPVADLGAEPQAEVDGDERLDCDCGDDREDGRPGQAEAEPDGQFVEAPEQCPA